ncbi:MAG: B12-binding domain-containing protein [Bacteroidales bacterium]
MVAQDFLNELLKGNRAGCSAIAAAYHKNNPSIKDLYEEVFKVALHEVGLLWENNKITVATEHIATAIVEGIMNEYFEQIISDKRFNKKVVLACVENELHQVGVKMVADIFEMKGWESYFLGAGIPVNELVKFIRETKPDLLAISLSIYFNFTALLNMVEIIRREFPELQLIVGGQAFSKVNSQDVAQLGGVLKFNDLYMLEKYIDAINLKS